MQQAWADYPSSVRGHNRAAAISVTEDVMAAFDSTTVKTAAPRAVIGSGPVTSSRSALVWQAGICETQAM